MTFWVTWLGEGDTRFSPGNPQGHIRGPLGTLKPGVTLGVIPSQGDRLDASAKHHLPLVAAYFSVSRVTGGAGGPPIL